MAIETNELAPDFTLKDYQGNEVSLSGFRNEKNVLLVFNRGFMWPFCRRHMAQLRQEQSKLVEKDVEVLVIGPENPEAFKKYWEREEMPFVGLPDPEHRVMDLYGQQVKLLKLGRMPAQMLVNKEGRIVHVHYGTSMADIPDTEEFLKALDQ